ncbi:hypothetical protein DFH09DRAFT_1079720 [Mycena vulgaris]|nr:hypothetical protein DFH09DRAFT_1079720 [Mycena vulgaris]
MPLLTPAIEVVKGDVSAAEMEEISAAELGGRKGAVLSGKVVTEGEAAGREMMTEGKGRGTSRKDGERACRRARTVDGGQWDAVCGWGREDDKRCCQGVGDRYGSRGGNVGREWGNGNGARDWRWGGLSLRGRASGVVPPGRTRASSIVPPNGARGATNSESEDAAVLLADTAAAERTDTGVRVRTVRMAACIATVLWGIGELSWYDFNSSGGRLHFDCSTDLGDQAGSTRNNDEEELSVSAQHQTLYASTKYERVMNEQEPASLVRRYFPGGSISREWSLAILSSQLILNRKFKSGKRDPVAAKDRSKANTGEPTDSGQRRFDEKHIGKMPLFAGDKQPEMDDSPRGLHSLILSLVEKKTCSPCDGYWKY